MVCSQYSKYFIWNPKWVHCEVVACIENINDWIIQISATQPAKNCIYIIHQFCQVSRGSGTRPTLVLSLDNIWSRQWSGRDLLIDKLKYKWIWLTNSTNYYGLMFGFSPFTNWNDQSITISKYKNPIANIIAKAW